MLSSLSSSSRLASPPQRFVSTSIGLLQDLRMSRNSADHLESSQENARRIFTGSQSSVRQSVDLAEVPLTDLNRAPSSSLGVASLQDNQNHPPPPPLYQNIPGVVPFYQGRLSGPPPSYEEVINPDAEPPTYQSLFGQIREARKSSRSLLDLSRRILIILLSTLGFTLVVSVMLLVPLSMIIVGALYIDQCRVEHLPAFLLVGGLVWASKNILHCYVQCEPNEPSSPARSASPRDYEEPSPFSSQNHSAWNPTSDLDPQTNRLCQSRRQERRLKSSICESLLNCILFGWFVAGCIIVFRSYEPNYDNPSSNRYCNRTVYLYSFWLIGSICSVFGFIIVSICVLMVRSSISSRRNLDDLV